jgi:ATP-dependent helicase Lhr and Lhr-like helicase
VTRKQPPGAGLVPRSVERWFAERGWQPFDFQREVWQAVAEGRSGLLHATTGAGKTYAVWLGALQAFADSAIAAGPTESAAPTTRTPTTRTPSIAPPLTVLWITPMRALAADTLAALQDTLPALAPHWSAGARSGDTGASERTAQNQRLPTVLVTTPESLSLLLSRADAQQVLGRVRMVVVDEWHELMGNKRGVQVQLALARLRHWQAQPQSSSQPQKGLCIWGMSATLGNLPQALHALLGPAATGSAEATTATLLPSLLPPQPPPLLVQGRVPKALQIDTLLPARVERFPWAGHLGLAMLPQVVAEIEASATTLVFTNTRSQAELWYQALLEARPDWAGQLALHHGSLDRDAREWVEGGLKRGEVRAVVCTSSLDLGVDFLPVERVLQIGSPKGIARLLQRAGRSGHAPGRPSRITLVPTHSLELIEGAAARAAVQAGQIESRDMPWQPLDVLVQHLVTVALGGGFRPDALYREVRSTAAYEHLSPEAWQWCLAFVSQGGESLAAYPDYRRAVPDEEGIWRVPDVRLARRHRMNIGTIVSEASMVVQYLGGGKLGSVEEGFVARLKRGDCFLFGGRLLELVRVHDMTAWVRRAQGQRPAVPRWNGGRMPLSTTLADAMVAQLAGVADTTTDTAPEMQKAQPLLALQKRWSALPTPSTLLAEVLTTREGTHLFLYPFAGRHVHLGLASLLAWRVARQQPLTFSMAVNDYGLELLSATPVDWATLLPQVLQAAPPGELLQEVLDSLNASEMAQRRFREIARVSGLIFQGYPGEKRSSRQLQASSSLFWEVFRKYDPANRLLLQAEQELLAQELEMGRLQRSLERMAVQQLVLKPLQRATPFAFPLMVERLREKLSNESMADRIARLLGQLEQAAGPDASHPGPTPSEPAPSEPAPSEDPALKVRQALAFGREHDQPPAGKAARTAGSARPTRAPRQRTPRPRA